jgi:hypothetical protein
MSCGCSGGKGATKPLSPPIYNLQSEPNDDSATVFIQSKMQISSKTFRRIFNSGTQIIVPESYASELVNLGAQVIIQ